MNDLIENLNIIILNKDKIIAAVKSISTMGVSKTQAQNLREYAARTTSIEELLLYIDYQCARDRNLKYAGSRLIELINQYKDKGIDLIRYMMGIFARWVMIESKRGE